MRHFAHLAAFLLAATITTATARAEDPPPVISCAGQPVRQAQPAVTMNPIAPPRIDVVFCIDCSGSMGGVIDTAKQKVWEIVNEIAKAKPVPVLRIGLLGYGLSERPGAPWESLMPERITGPLGMTSTAVTAKPTDRERLAQGHGTEGQPSGPGRSS